LVSSSRLKLNTGFELPPVGTVGSGPSSRSTLSDGLRAVVAQTLFKRIDRKGRCAALEILIATPAVRNLIREAKTYQIPSMIQTGKKYAMQLLDDAIMELYNKGWIGGDEAYTKANDKSKFRPFLKNPPTDFTEV
jgi:twitching motility protein PilT